MKAAVEQQARVSVAVQDGIDAAKWIGGVSFCVLLFLGMQMPPSNESRALIVLGFSLLGLPVGALLYQAQQHRFVRNKLRPFEFNLEITGLAAFCLVAGYLSYWFGMHQFAGLDCSVTIDYAWRMLSGQKPYVDFPCTTPVGFSIGAELAFRIFGVNWRSNVLINTAYLMLTTVWLYALLRCTFNSRLLALLAVAFYECATTLLTSFWWYNSVTQIAGLLFVLSCVAVVLRPGSKRCWISFVASLTWAALMKPNIGGVVVLGCTATLFVNPKYRVRAILASTVAFILWAGIICSDGLNPVQVVQSYLSVANRGYHNPNFMGCMYLPEKILSFTALGLILLPGIVTAFKRRKVLIREFSAIDGIVIASLLGGFYGFLTNVDLKMVDCPLILTACLLFATRSTASHLSKLELEGNWRWFYPLLLATLALAGAGQGYTRNRAYYGGGYGVFFENQITECPFKTDFFKGTKGGLNLWASNSQISLLIEAKHPKSIYFGPWLNWAYAAFKVPPPKGQPICWDPGGIFSFKDEEVCEQRWIDSKFEYAVLLMPPPNFSGRFLRRIEEAYTLDPEFPPQKVFLQNGNDYFELTYLVLKLRTLPIESSKVTL